MKRLVCIVSMSLILVSCGNNDSELAKQRSIDSMSSVLAQQEVEMAHQGEIDSLNAIVAAKEAETQAVKKSPTSRTYNSTQYVQGNAAKSNATPTTAKRKGLSTTATGAVIGAGVGAISGAIIDKKKGRGAIIGGVAGAGIGAGTGAIIESTKKK